MFVVERGRFERPLPSSSSKRLMTIHADCTMWLFVAPYYDRVMFVGLEAFLLIGRSSILGRVELLGNWPEMPVIHCHWQKSIDCVVFRRSEDRLHIQSLRISLWSLVRDINIHCVGSHG